MTPARLIPILRTGGPLTAALLALLLAPTPSHAECGGYVHVRGGNAVVLPFALDSNPDAPARPSCTGQNGSHAPAPPAPAPTGPDSDPAALPAAPTAPAIPSRSPFRPSHPSARASRAPNEVFRPPPTR